MIENFRQPWLPFLYDIDLRSYEWPWPEEKWQDIKSYIIRVYPIHHVPRGFSSFKVISDSIIKVSKLCVHPDWRGDGIGAALQNDLIKCARKYGKSRLVTTIHEYNSKGMDWLRAWGWIAIGVEKGIFPDNTDGFTFERGIVI